MTARQRRLLTGLCVALALGVYLTGVGETFLYGHQGWCAARRSVAGLNFVRHGFDATTYGPVENFGVVEPDDFSTYWHHPVGIHLLVGASFTVFGDGEVQARAVPVALMLLSFLLFGALARRWWPGPGRWVALLGFITTPMLGYYGPFVNQEPLVLFAALLMVWLWTRWVESGALRFLALTALVGILGAWSDWPWFVFAFALATIELGRLLVSPLGTRDVRWLLVFCPSVLLGLFGVLAHLFAINGAKDPAAGFDNIFSDRSGGTKETLSGLLGAAGPEWVDLLTPAMVVAGIVWLFIAARDLWQREFATRHAVGLAFLSVGAIWAITFKQGARIHEYWPFYAAIYFVMAAADIVDRVTRRLLAAGPAGVGRTLAIGFVVGAVLLQASAGLAGIMKKHRHPDANNFESDGYRARHAVLGRWLAANTDPEDRIAFQDEIAGTAKFQMGFYTRRNRTLHRIDSRRTRFRPPQRALAVIDLRRVPQTVQGQLLDDWLARYPVTVVDEFAVADLRRRVETPEVSWWTSRERLPSLWHQWLESSVYRPSELVRDHVMEAAMLRAAGHTADAVARYGEAGTMPADLRHHVSDYNLARSAGLTPDPAPWLAEQTGLPEGETAPIQFGDALELRGLRSSTSGRYRVVLECIYAVVAPPGDDWRPFADRFSTPFGDEEERKRPLGVRVFPGSDRWRVGDLVYVRIHVPLHPEHEGLAVRFGFWRPGSGGKSRKEHLDVGRERGLRVEPPGVVPIAAWPPWGDQPTD